MKRKERQKITKLIAFVLVALMIIGPFLSVIALIRESKQTYAETIAVIPLGSEVRKLPIYCVDTKGEKKVSLTFDAAWGDEDAEEILDILSKYGVKATFFMVGDWVRKYPELVKRLAEEGHDVANHSNKHPHVNALSKEAIKKDIMDAHETIKNVTGKECNLYRPPYGEYNNTVLEAAKECRYHTVQWDVDSIDWKGYDAPTIVDKVVNHKHLGDGSIILLHNGAKHTAEALPQIIEGLQSKGYTLVPISELIYKENYLLDHEGRQYQK